MIRVNVRSERWRPAGAGFTSPLAHNPPDARALITSNRKIWFVLEVRDRDLIDWDEYDRLRLTHAQAIRDQRIDRRRRLAENSATLSLPSGTRFQGPTTPNVYDLWDGTAGTWWNRPRVVMVRPHLGGKRLHWRWPHDFWAQCWALPEHHAICGSCGEIYPCTEVEAAKQASREMVNVEKLMSIPPGACWHCQQPISQRQQSVTFPGDNLLLPGGPPVAFHLRRSGGCGDAAAGYETRWREAKANARLDDEVNRAIDS
ncbi:hypothetical protein [Frankia sp. R82]|uniref:hypothetical protein n=1 Tax=Frankia sp. R82 TaxID=2950553 RepID=UPI002043C06B|nr:hypothetical protein [Frankia sp. R82]MCM3884147.1 hypothetical protein [Frankia sp. R82]